MQSVSEDTPLWDEDDALDEAEVEAKAKTKAKPVKKAAKPAAKPAAKAVVPKVKKAVAKAAKSGAAAAKVTHSQSSAIHDFRILSSRSSDKAYWQDLRHGAQARRQMMSSG